MTHDEFMKIISPKTDEKEEFDDFSQTLTFPTKERLMADLLVMGLSEEWYIIVRTGDDVGRWTAIFSKDKIDRDCNTSVIHVIDCGFKVI